MLVQEILESQQHDLNDGSGRAYLESRPLDLEQMNAVQQADCVRNLVAEVHLDLRDEELVAFGLSCLANDLENWPLLLRQVSVRHA